MKFKYNFKSKKRATGARIYADYRVDDKKQEKYSSFRFRKP